MRIEKFTTKLQEALAEAQSNALGQDRQYIEPQHLLLALLNQEDGGAAGLISKAGGNPNALKKALADNVGVATIPTNGGAQSSTLQYNWLWGVDKNSKQAQESWKFLTWLNGPQGSGSSRMGKYLTTSLNAIPARVSDQQANSSLLGDAFVKPFVDSLKTSRSEPIIPGAQEIKTVLQKQIEAAWFGQKSVKDALDAAATEANRILSEKK